VTVPRQEQIHRLQSAATTRSGNDGSGVVGHFCAAAFSDHGVLLWHPQPGCVSKRPGKEPMPVARGCDPRCAGSPRALDRRPPGPVGVMQVVGQASTAQRRQDANRPTRSARACRAQPRRGGAGSNASTYGRSWWRVDQRRVRREADRARPRADADMHRRWRASLCRIRRMAGAARCQRQDHDDAHGHACTPSRHDRTITLELVAAEAHTARYGEAHDG
jgi:hypothetical protein